MSHEQTVIRTGEQALGATVLRLRKDADFEFWSGRLDDLVATIPDGKPATMRTWLGARDGQDVFTLQVRVDMMSQEVRGLWTPGARRIEAAQSRVKFIEPGGGPAAFSVREYLGVRALRSSDTTWIGYDPLTCNLIAYTAVNHG